MTGDEGKAGGFVHVFPDRLRQAREKRSLTVTRLADLLDLPSAILRTAERTGEGLTAGEVDDAADLLGVSTPWLLGLDGCV